MVFALIRFKIPFDQYECIWCSIFSWTICHERNKERSYGWIYPVDPLGKIINFDWALGNVSLNWVELAWVGHKSRKGRNFFGDIYSCRNEQWSLFKISAGE